MRLRLLVVFVAGAAFFTVLPIYAPPVVLQSEEVPRFFMGLAATTIAGAVLNLASGHRRALGLPFVLACALVGTFVHTVVYALPTYGVGVGGEAFAAVVILPIFTFAYLGIPAGIGAVLAGLARWLVDRQRP